MPGPTRDPASYPEILLLNGFGDPEALSAATHAWRHLFRIVNPGLLVLDYAPTALLAARGMECPKVLFGIPFASPPRISPMPSFRPWQRVPMQRLVTSERRALDAANAALKAAGTPALDALYDLFDVEEEILTTFAELDPYRSGRRRARYWGPLFTASGEPPLWPEGEGKKIFVYLRPDSPAFRPLAIALRKTAHPTLWFAPGLTAKAIDAQSGPSMRFTSRAVDLAQVAKSADAAFLHSGHGTTAAMLLGGVPVLLFPEQVEQLLLARNVAALGAGAIVPSRALRADLTEPLARFVENETFRERAKQFAEKYKGFDQQKQLTTMIARIEKLLLTDYVACGSAVALA